MKILLLTVLPILLFLCVGMAFAQDDADAADGPEAEDAATSSETPRPQDAKGAYRHVVLFKFKDGTDESKVKEIETGFHALPSKIDSIIDYEWGVNVSPEGLDKGHTHCFLVTFKDKAGLDVYLPHADHKAFVELLLPHIDSVTVLDYVSAAK